MTYREWLAANNLENTQANVERWVGSLEAQGYDPGDVSWDFVLHDLGLASGQDIRTYGAAAIKAAADAAASTVTTLLGKFWIPLAIAATVVGGFYVLGQWGRR